MLKVYGTSDDLIEMEGDLSEEFCFYPDDDKTERLGFSDGTIVSVTYDNDGIWRLNLLMKGTLFDFKEEFKGSPNDNKYYSDVLYFKEGIGWVLYGNQLAKKPIPKPEVKFAK